MKLNDTARAELRTSNVDPAEWPQLNGYGPGEEWRGDACGCTDDRCIGHHHDEAEPCGCLPALIDEHWKTVHAGEEGREVWALHERANASGSAEDRAAADERLSEWIATYQPGAIAFELTPQGITYRNRYNPHTWLVWNAERAAATVEQVA